MATSFMVLKPDKHLGLIRCRLLGSWAIPAAHELCSCRLVLFAVWFTGVGVRFCSKCGATQI